VLEEYLKRFGDRMTEWIKCSDRTPEIPNGSLVVYVFGLRRFYNIPHVYEFDGESWRDTENEPWGNVEYWLPFPERPKGDNDAT
jgi:hypothetical protein